MPIPAAWNRAPLPPNSLTPLPPCAIRAAGWLRTQIERERPRNEEDRLLCAVLLGDAALERRAQAEAEAYLDTEPQDCLGRAGWLMRYYGFRGDKRVPRALLCAVRSLYQALPGHPLSAQEAADISLPLQTALWLYNLTGQKGLLEFCRLLKAQAPDWTSTLHVFPQTRPVADAPDPQTDAYWRAHGVAVAAGLKTAGMQALFEGGLKNETAFSVGWSKLVHHHGAAHGLFNADPLLAGANPSRGLSPQVVVQMLDTLPALLWALGDPACGDVLESAVFNALPASRGLQRANQLLPGEGEPAAGWARYGASLWMAASDGGLAAIGYAPCQVRWRLCGHAVRLQVDTSYPAEERVRILVHTAQPAAFPIHLRIPAWAEGARWQVNGEEESAAAAGRFARVERVWREGDVLTLLLPMAVRTVPRYHQSLSVERGPLVYALAVEKETPWNLALLAGRGLEAGREDGLPVVYACAAATPSWERSGDVPAPPPVAPCVRAEDARRVRLVPYGVAGARIAQFPGGTERS